MIECLILLQISLPIFQFLLVKSDGDRMRVGRKWNSSNSFNSDSLKLLTLILTPFLVFTSTEESISESDISENQSSKKSCKSRSKLIHCVVENKILTFRMLVLRRSNIFGLTSETSASYSQPHSVSTYF